jgi:DNA-binding CsgD family transcriptional regulator
MELLGINDTHRLHLSIQAIYALHNSDTFGVDVISIINQIVPGNFPTFYSCCFRTRQISDIYLPEFAGALTPELEKIRIQYFGEHPIAKHIPQTLHGAYKISDFISQQEFHQLEGVYQQFLRHFDVEDVLNIFFPADNSGDWQKLAQQDIVLNGFSVARTERTFTERDRLILNLLRPHLFQAYCNSQKYQQLQQNLNQLQKSINHIGLVILNPEGQVQSVTPLATTWLEIYCAKPTSTSQLPDHLWSWVKYQVGRFKNNLDPTNASLPLRIQQSDKQLVISLVIEKDENRYLLLLEEQTTSLIDSLSLLGLSKRETEVLAWVMQGKDNKIIAAQLGVGTTTVRGHLESIYRKWGINSRTEAIAQALQKLGFINPFES